MWTQSGIFSATDVRLQYTDNLRTHAAAGNSRACRWHIFIDGAACPSGDVIGDVYALDGDNAHRTRTVAGYCSGVPAGTHTVQVYVSNSPSYSARCYTGWNQQHWLLEAEEVQ